MAQAALYYKKPQIKKPALISDDIGMVLVTEVLLLRNTYFLWEGVGTTNYSKQEPHIMLIY